MDCHRSALLLVAELSEGQFRWRPPKGPQSIAWNLWHIARWDDVLAEVLVARTASLSHLGPAHQIWKSSKMAEDWRLGGVQLGVEDAGTGLADADAATINLPEKHAVVGYVSEAFRHLDTVLTGIDDALLPQIVPPPVLYPSQLQPDTYGDDIMIWLQHANAHLGMMEALKGMLGLRGSLSD